MESERQKQQLRVRACLVPAFVGMTSRLRGNDETFEGIESTLATTSP